MGKNTESRLSKLEQEVRELRAMMQLDGHTTDPQRVWKARESRMMEDTNQLLNFSNQLFIDH